MTDDQFEKFINLMSGRQADHDLLVEIKTVVKLNHENYERDKNDMHEKIGVVNRVANAAHKRLDYIFTGGMIAIGGLVLSVITFFFNHKL